MRESGAAAVAAHASRKRQASSVKRQASSVKRQASSVKRQASSVERRAKSEERRARRAGPSASGRARRGATGSGHP
ncbi:hypothetical protein C7S16_6864 [Burkholderia thailandensis]|uniref:6-phosphofructokinase n=1 Tax=Burkholderia thailandensis TaxID=57975 RepID=A0AAW9CNR0_BURTH|nr:hypothetical protein [Burkholderia thailandensis]